MNSSQGTNFLLIQRLVVILLYSVSSFLHSQEIEINSSIRTGGYISNEETLPFWLYNNTFSEVGSETNFSARATSKATVMLSEKAGFVLGAGFLLRDNVTDEFQRDELYIEYQNSWLHAVLGSKRVSDSFQGLSVVANDFFISGNTRALPGLLIEASNPLKISDRFEVDWGIAHYSLNDNRYVRNTRIHYKRLHLIWNVSNKAFLKGGITHYAQWAGTSPETGKQPDDFKAFFDIFLAKQGGGEASDTDQFNVLGNHLGSYNIEYSYNPISGSYLFYHQHPFEDGSGTRLKNFPDGIWGFYFKPNSEEYTSFLQGLVIEYIQTTDQSGATGASGSDNYFNSGLYRSGWTYNGNVIGLPFISFNENGLRTENSRIRGINIGLSAKHKNWSYMLKTSFTENFGTYRDPFTPNENRWYNWLGIDYATESFGIISLQLGYDYNDRRNNVVGAGLQYTYSF